MSVRFKSVTLTICLGLLVHAKTDAYSLPWINSVFTAFVTQSSSVIKQYAAPVVLGLGALGTTACIVDYRTNKKRYDVLNSVKKELDDQCKEQMLRPITFEVDGHLELSITNKLKDSIKAFNEQLTSHRKNNDSDRIVCVYYAQARGEATITDNRTMLSSEDLELDQESINRCKEMCSRYQELYKKVCSMVDAEQAIMQQSYQKAWRCAAVLLGSTAAAIGLKVL